MGDDGAKNLHQTQNHNDTGANGNTEVSYTWELGNGMALHVGAGRSVMARVMMLKSTALRRVSASAVMARGCPGLWQNPFFPQ